MLSKPIITKVTGLLFIDDLKVFAQSQTKLSKALISTQEALKDIDCFHSRDENPDICCYTTIFVYRCCEQIDCVL